MFKSLSKISCYLIVTLMLFSSKALAFKISNDDLTIKSDNLMVNQKKRVAIFKGMVTLHFNDLCLRTHEIKLLYKQIDNKNTIDKIIIPNKLSAIRFIDESIIIADSAKYSASNNQLILKGNVIIQNDGNILSTNQMIYITNLNDISEYKK